MKNLSIAKTGSDSRCVPSKQGERITPPEKTFRRRPEIQFQTPKYRAKIQWMIEDFDSFHAALLRKLSLGSLPKRAAKYACADFDLEDERKYCGDDGMAVDGGKLAGIAAYIVRYARDPIDYLFSLKNVPAQVIEPIKTYLRVKLAMGRLAAEIEAAKTIQQEFNTTVISAFAKQTSKTSSEKTNVESSLRLTPLSTPESKAIFLDQRPCADEIPHRVRDDNAGVSSSKPTPKFAYHTSPAKTYGFKEMTAQYGYDPRDTSVYWIEKRVASLRRKWKRHGEQLLHQEHSVSNCNISPNSTSINHNIQNSEPEIKYFQPADADYNSVWPPIKLPDGPPKLKPEPVAETRKTMPVTDHKPDDDEAALPVTIPPVAASVTEINLASGVPVLGIFAASIKGFSAPKFAAPPQETTQISHDKTTRLHGFSNQLPDNLNHQNYPRAPP